MKILSLFFVGIFFYNSFGWTLELTSEVLTKTNPKGNYSWLLAQADDSHDPFADYSEFEVASEEEADINFFRHGRFFNIGFLGGLRTFTDVMGEIYSTKPTFGLFITYFFDLQFALEFAYETGNHTLFVQGNGGSLRSSVNISMTSFNLKYYFNTENLTRGLAILNPYIIGGFGQYTRVFAFVKDSAKSKDGGTAFKLGAGVEIPLLRKRMYLGFQGSFHYVNFPDEGSEIPVKDGDGNQVSSRVQPRGDILVFYSVLGINF